MEGFLLFVIVVVLFIRWLMLRSRLADLEQRIEFWQHLSQEQSRTRNLLANLEQRIEGAENARQQSAELTQRVFALEQALKRPPVEAGPAVATAKVEEPVAHVVPQPEAVPIPAPPRVPDFHLEPKRVPIPPPPKIPDFHVEPEPPPSRVISKPVPVETPPVPPPLARPIPEPVGPSFSERMRERMSGEEWEAIVGGSWLNKLGVFVLVVGVALFLGYSFTRIGPAGRAAISLAISASMLGGGVFLERRARYINFGRGLIGGGWAALYSTTYAMHAVDAAKVIGDPLVGAVLLLAVAVGMIGHSLRYRSQTVTGLAYFIAFVTLAIASSTLFSVFALIPLAASLLFVAYRFNWSEMALFGLIATYGTCASRGDSGAPIWSAQSLFTVYWLLFEGFDLLRAARRTDTNPERAILPLNALAFAVLSHAKWSAAAPQHLYALAAGIAAAYLASAITRAWLRPPSSFDPEAGTLARILGGGYEGPVTLAAAGSAVALLLKFHGGWANAGLLAEAEVLFLAGLFFREAYLRGVSASLFAVVLGKILAFDIPAGGKWRNFQAWTPSAAVTAVLLYINRALRAADQFYGYGAAAVCALIIGFETSERFLGMAWLLFASAAFTFGWARRLQDFRIQGYCVAALGLCGVAVHQVNVAAGQSPASTHIWIGLSAGALVAYLATLCGLYSAESRFSPAERDALNVVAPWVTTAALMALAWRLAPERYVGVGWIALALVLLELGLRGLPREFRAQSYFVAMAGAFWVLVVNVVPVQNTGPLWDRLATAFATLLAYAFAVRAHMARESRTVVDVASSAGTIFGLTALWTLLPPAAVGPAWAALSLLLLETGLALDLPGVRLQAHASAGAAFGRLFVANFTGLGETGGISLRVLTVVPVIAAHYYSRSRLREREQRQSRAYLYSGAILIAALMRFELGRSMVAGGWAIFALALIWLGQRWDNTDLRWQSYGIAGLAFLRSWITDFYDPAALAGAAQRIVIGALVIACLFVSQLVLPHLRPRLYYSLMATVLLTIVLFHEVSGSMHTVAWGVEGVGLLVAGFPLRDRNLRLSGLSLFLICIMKLFFYDLRNLETMYRILSFIVLGLIMVSVSWIYTRFHDHVKRLL